MSRCTANGAGRFQDAQSDPALLDRTGRTVAAGDTIKLPPYAVIRLSFAG
jgi:hypothetical protein